MPDLLILAATAIAAYAAGGLTVFAIVLRGRTTIWRHRDQVSLSAVENGLVERLRPSHDAEDLDVAFDEERARREVRHVLKEVCTGR